MEKNNEDVIMSICLNESLRSEIKEAAKCNGLSVSAYIRQLVERDLMEDNE